MYVDVDVDEDVAEAEDVAETEAVDVWMWQTDSLWRTKAELGISSFSWQDVLVKSEEHF